MMMKEFTDEEIRMMAESERNMDSGITFFVVHDGGHFPVMDEVAEELGLVRGQRINNPILIRILEKQIAISQREIAKQDAENAIDRAKASQAQKA